jgi:SAM-dependent methyltransferase
MSLSYLQTTLNSRLALPLQELDDLSTYLTREWEMYCFAERTRGFTTFADSKKKAFKAFGELCAQRADMMADAAVETQSDALKFYTRLSKPPFGPWVMGARWPHILSSLAAVDELCTALKPTSVLEVGCGFGFAGRWLGSKHQIDYLGIDICYDAIAAGRDRANIAAQAPRHRREMILGSNPLVGFMKGDINEFPPINPWGQSPKKYDLIFSIAGMPSEMDGALIDKISNLLTPNGVIYIHVSGAPGFASRWKTKPTKMELVFEDSLGGLANGMSGYEHTAGYIFAPKRSGLTPALFHPLDSWHDFAECMNSGHIHERERNFAYFNSYGRRANAWQFRPQRWEDITPHGFTGKPQTPKPPAIEFSSALNTVKPKSKAKKPRKKSAARKLAEIKKANARVAARALRLERILKELRKAKKSR